MTLRFNDPRAAVAAVRAGDVDATFRTITDRATLPRDLQMIRAFDSPLELVVGPRHPLASARAHTTPIARAPRPGAGHRAAKRMGRVLRSTHRRIRSPFDTAGPNFGNEVLLDTLAVSADVATIVGARDRYTWPMNYDLRRIPLVNPTIAYPISLIVPRTNPHRGLRAIINHYGSLAPLPETTWLLSWAATPRRH